MQQTDLIQQLRSTIDRGDAAALTDLLVAHPELGAELNRPGPAFGAPPVFGAARRKHFEVVDVLIRHGADINARSDWWAGGFGVLDWADQEGARFLISRGAVVDAHAAAHLGMLKRLAELVAANPQVVHARGGDGQTPLHFAGTVEVAAFLLDHGADIDARDVDHESTPAQYMVGERQPIARYLVSRGCKTDLLLASALGETETAVKLLDSDPDCIRLRVSERFFPMVNSKAGGTIYQWQLGWYVSAHQVAKKFGHEQLLSLLMQRTPDDEKLLVACWMHDAQQATALLQADPALASRLPDAANQLAHAARNNDIGAVRLMLGAGFGVDGHSQHHAMPLHWAGWHGNVPMMQMLLQHAPALDDDDNDFKSTPLGWTIHASEHGWNANRDFAGAAKLLIDSGARLPKSASGSAPVRQILEQAGVKAERT